MIRPYQPTDKSQLTKIFTLNIPRYFAQEELADYEAYLEEKGDTYLTIEYKGEIVGGVGYYVEESDGSGRITWIFLHPDSSGQGLGRVAVEYCLEVLNSIAGIEKLVVTTSQLAYTFFEKFEYRVIRTEKDYWGRGLDLYWMERGLDKGQE